MRRARRRCGGYEVLSVAVELNILYDKSLLQGRPLYDNDADTRYFVVPPSWDVLMRAIDRGLNVLLTGKRGSGKTTLLRQAQLALRRNDVPVVFADATAARDAADLAARFRDALRGPPSPLRAGVAGFRVAAGALSPQVEGGSRALHDDLAALGEAAPSVALVDASGSAAAAYEIFGRQRDTLWQFEHRWVVAVDEEERATVLKPPADAFFDTVIDLDELSIEGLIQLVEKRDDTLSPDERMRIAAEAHGNPRLALRAVNRALVHGLEPDRYSTERADALERATRLGRPHAMLMAELLDLGQASPSDEALQYRLGLSRARITQLLRDLLDQGLVETRVERTDGPGRPRTIYHPAVGSA